VGSQGGGAGRPVDAEWLHRFHDRRLDAMVAEAVSNSPDMRVAAARVDQAVERARIVRRRR
jgi:outer membrane protein TolC